MGSRHIFRLSGTGGTFAEIFTGTELFVVTVNNKVVGCVSSKTDVEKAVHESRRQMAKESEGYLMQEISYETTESHKPFQKLLSETALKEKITKELKKENSGEIFAYTVSAGENQLSFATLDEVETFLGRLKEEQDTDNRFEIEFKRKQIIRRECFLQT